jgi:hypothetical protein
VKQFRAEHPDDSNREIGLALDINYMTMKRVMEYSRLMERLGVSEPFVELTEKPARASRWRDRVPVLAITHPNQANEL